MNKKQPEYREMREWAGLRPRDKYDPDYVNVEVLNADLAILPGWDEWKLTSENYFDE